MLNHGGSLQAAQQGGGRGREEEEGAYFRPDTPRTRRPSGPSRQIFLRSSTIRPRRLDGPLTAPFPRSRTHQAAIKQVKEWVESYIPDAHLANHDCVVDVSEVRALNPPPRIT